VTDVDSSKFDVKYAILKKEKYETSITLKTMLEFDIFIFCEVYF